MSTEAAFKQARVKYALFLAATLEIEISLKRRERCL